MSPRSVVRITVPSMYEGQLVRAVDGTWMTKPPSRCPNGHNLGPNQVLVGHVVCLGHGGGGHTSWHCRTCDAVVYGPPMVADRMPAGDPDQMSMRIAPRTFLCATASRLGGVSVETGYTELRDLCTASGDQRSLAVGMIGIVS